MALMVAGVRQVDASQNAFPMAVVSKRKHPAFCGLTCEVNGVSLRATNERAARLAPCEWRSTRLRASGREANATQRTGC